MQFMRGCIRNSGCLIKLVGIIKQMKQTKWKCSLALKRRSSNAWKLTLSSYSNDSNEYKTGHKIFPHSKGFKHLR